jgi:serralysin
MADIRLSANDDTYEHAAGKEWANIYGLAGNDKIIIHGSAGVVGGPGDDQIINDVFSWISGSANYWDSPKAIYVDLEAGYALDGYGTRDTLVNIREVSTPGRDGDVVLGTSKNDSVWLGGFWQGNAKGSARIDLRGGNDKVSIYDAAREDFKIEVALDGKSATLSKYNYSVTLQNVESVLFRKVINGQNFDQSFQLFDLIDFSKVGAATLIQNKTDGWTTTAGKSLTYSFMGATPSYGGAEGGTGFTAPTAAYKTAVKSIFDRLSQELGVSFSEVADSTTSYGQIRFGANQQATTKGYAYVPGQVKDDRAGDVWLDVETLQLLGKGQEGWEVLLHEIGHALGLSHPHADTETTTATKLVSTWNNNGYTVMSSIQSTNQLWQSWFGALDMQALQSLYGGAKSVSNASDTYKLPLTQGLSMDTLRDAGGSQDVLDLSAQSLGVWVDLKSASFSSVGTTASGYAATNNLFIDANTVNEKAVGTKNDDVLYGNDVNNIFYEGGGNDKIDGRAGLDTVVFVEARAGYTLTKSTIDSSWSVEARNGALGSDEVLNIERLQFADTKIALDVDANPAMAAKLIGVILGGSWVDSLFISGLALGILDNGYTPATLARLGLESTMFVGLAGSASNKDFYNLVYKNVYGKAPDAATLQSTLSQMDSGKATQADMVMKLVDVPQNLINIDLVGIQLNGFEYVG